ncbi:MAG TPA: GAF domain-containing protein [Thermoanaerobaculia bacterium]|nr:GAF domain-containing protein [Thermoanaerobaculia bacterium]
MIKKTPATDYVHKVQEKTNEYIRELLEANASLRRHNASLESSITELRQERVQLKEEALKLRESLEETRAERRELDRRLTQVEYENQEFSTRYVAVEQQNNNLVNLYAATNQLHSTLDREEILIILQEIVINLVGSEEYAIYVREGESAGFDVIAMMGLDGDAARRGIKSKGLTQAVAHGELWISSGADLGGDEPRACVPLRLGDRVIGVIAVFGLLVQKGDFEPVDYELFNLLASQAATALYASGLHASATARAAATGAR